MFHTLSNARRVRRTILILLVLLPLALPGRAYAHAILLQTEPGIDQVVGEPPATVTLNFTEPVEIAFGAIRVFDSKGNRVDAGAARHIEGSRDVVEAPLEDDLVDGTYTVSWRVVSADSHPVSEAFVFHVGAPGAPPTGLAAAALEGEEGTGSLEGGLAGLVRWVNFVALILLAGASLFLVLVWRRTKPGTNTRPAEMEAIFGRRWRRTLIVAWWTLVAATLAGIVLQGAVAGGLSLSDAASADVMRQVLETRYGSVAVAKMVLLAMGVGLWIVVSRTGSLPVRTSVDAREPASVGAAGVIAAVPAWVILSAGAVLVGLLATPGLAGHPAVTDPVWMNVLMDVIHMSAAAAWLGGLAMLLFAALPASRRVHDTQRSMLMAPVVSRYSDLAFWSVTALVASGIYRSFIEVAALRALTSTVYGKVLLIKLAVFMPLLILGVINNRYIKPRLERLGADASQSRRPLSILRRTVGTEVALGAVVLALTALLVNIAPGRVDAGLEGPFIRDVAIGDMNVNVLIDPNEVGENLVHVTATTPAGAPVRELRAVDVRFSMSEEDIGQLVGEGRELAPGHYVVQGRQLSIAGEWTLEFTLRTGRFEEHSKKIDVTVNRQEKKMKKLVTFVAGASLALAVAAPAVAHVTVQPNEAIVGSFSRFVVRVPNERDNASTIKVELQLPPLASISFEPKDGWQREEGTGEFDEPLEAFGEEVTEGVVSVTWSGGRVAPGEFTEFGFSTRTPDEETTLEFRSLQTYDNGEVVRWTGAPDSDTPAATLTTHDIGAEEDQGQLAVLAEVAGEVNSGEETGEDGDAADDDEDDDMGIVLGGVGAGLGALALILSLVALRRKP